MPVSLLDINVLIALAWPNHECHQAAHAWFAAHASEGWATCPMTQCGFVRISANPRIIAEAVAPSAAVALLHRMLAHPQHVFWTDDITFVAATYVSGERIIGHRQVTDAYLLGLSLHHGGRLVTFDRGIVSLARNEHDQQLVLVISK